MLSIRNRCSRWSAFVVLLFSCLVAHAQDNKLTIEDFTIVPGEEKVVEINLSNATPVSSLQFDMVLPEGLQMVEESLQKVDSRITKSSHNVLSNDLGSAIRVAVFSNAVDYTKSGIKGNEGAILTFSVKADASFKTGTIQLTQIIGSNGTIAQPEALEMADYSAKVTAYAGGYVFECADSQITDTRNSYAVFRLNDAVQVVGIQMDLVLPEGISVPQNEEGYELVLSERVSENARIGMNRMNDGVYRVIVSSLTNEVFDASTDALFTMALVADGAFEGSLDVVVKNVKVSDPQGNTFPIDGDGTLTFGYIDVASNEAAYVKLSAEVAALTEAYNAAVADITENCPDVKDNFNGAGIAASIEAVKAEIDSLYAAVALTAESSIEEEKAAVNTAIETLVAEAKAAQAAFEADVAAKAANEAAYTTLSAEVAALTEAYNAAVADIAENCADVKDNFTGAGIAASIEAVKTEIDSLYAAVALTAESSIEEEKAAVNAAIEALVAEAKAAQAAFEADVAAKDANDRAYSKLIVEVVMLTQSYEAAVADIEKSCPNVKENFTGAEIAADIAAIQAEIDSLHAAVALTAESTIAEEKKAVNAAIETLVAEAKAAQAAFEADAAAKAANEAAYKTLSAEVAALSEALTAALADIAENCPSVKDRFTGEAIVDSIAAVQTEIDSLYAAVALTAESTIEAEKAAVNKAIETLVAEAKALQAAYVLEPGTYYIRNAETGAYLVGGNSWGTQATAGAYGIDWGVAFADGKYTLDSKISNGGNNHYLGDNGFVDGGATGMTLVLTETGMYKIVSLDSLVLTAPAADAGTTVIEFKADENSALAVWEFVTKETLDSELAEASIDHVMDATYLIPGANFGRNDTRNNSWTFEASNKNISDGDHANNNAESWHSTFTLTQTVTVPNGAYALTAQGFYRQDGTDNDNLPYFFANEETLPMMLKTGAENSMADASASFTAGLYTTDPIYVEVTDGTLTLGVKNDVNTNLWCIWDNFRLSYYGAEVTAAELKAAAVNEAVYKTLSAEVTLLSDALAAALADIAENCPSVKDRFTGEAIADSIAAVQTEIDSLYAAAALTAESTIEAEKAAVNKAIETLVAEAKALQAAYVLEPGTYYIRNAETGAYLVGGNSWGTQATAGAYGIDWGVAFADGKYTLDSKISNGGESHYLGANGFVDGGATGMTLVLTETGMYKIVSPDSLVLTAPAADAGTTVIEFKADENSALAVWEFVTKETLDSELAEASIDHVMDATYLIPGANFGRNDTRNNSWTFEASHKNISGGDNANNNAESYHSVFSLTQTVNVPNGVYTLTAQGFYRQDGSDYDNLPYFFANEETMPMLEKTGAENSMSEASASFTAGLYTTDPIYVEVTDGTLTLGVKNDLNTNLWCIWDNFRLSYYGDDTTIEEVQQVVAIEGVAGEVKPAAGIYTIGGIRLNELQKGYNIVVEEDGSVKKIFVQ